MKVIERYIFRRALVLFCAALVWTLAIVWTTQVLARIDLVTDSGQSALAFFEIADADPAVGHPGGDALRGGDRRGADADA